MDMSYEVNQIVIEAQAELMKKADSEWHLKDNAKANASQVLENMMRAFGYAAEVSFVDDQSQTLV